MGVAQATNNRKSTRFLEFGNYRTEADQIKSCTYSAEIMAGKISRHFEIIEKYTRLKKEQWFMNICS